MAAFSCCWLVLVAVSIVVFFFSGVDASAVVDKSSILENLHSYSKSIPRTYTRGTFFSYFLKTGTGERS